MCPGFKSLHRHHSLLKRFRKELKGLPLKGGERVLLAVSGGGDSMGMLALFLSALPRPDVSLGLAHVHHNLRGREADRDMAAVQSAAGSLGLPFLGKKLAGKPAKGQSVEAWGREQRYAALEAMRKEDGWHWVATAHSLDDQAETVFMRIGRGTGIEGLEGIHPVRGRVVRPVLELTGDELRAAAGECGFRWLEDSTNGDRRFLRNRVRRELLPEIEKAMPGFRRHLGALARLSRHQKEAGTLPNVAILEGNTLYYSLEVLALLNDGEGKAVLREGIRTIRGHLRGITEKHLQALWHLRHTHPGACVALPGRWEGVREGKIIRLRQTSPGRKDE
ncbi:MAG: tRNA lysidine(34) synthetase TilS [Acidobacteriota bacterium]